MKVNQPPEVSYERDWIEDAPKGVHRALDEEPALTPEQTDLLNEIKAHELAMKDKPAGNGRRQFHDEEMMRIMETHYLANQERLQNLEADAEKVRRKYEERQNKPDAVQRNALALRRDELRYETLDKESLQREALECIEAGGESWTPDRILVLNKHLQRVDAQAVSIGQPPRTRPFLEWVRTNKRDEPWRYDAPELFRAIDVYTTPFGQTVGLDGKHGTLNVLDITKMYKGPR